MKPYPHPTLAPPQGYLTWLDYAVATMDTRDLYNLHVCSDGQSPWPDDVQREDFRRAAGAELDALRRGR